jgi:hypothetical protein
LPEKLLIDKQVAKNFFCQFGSIKSFILNFSKKECVVEYDTSESARRAINSDLGISIVPMKFEPPKPDENFIDPDVAAELDSMLPGASKLQKPSE